MGFTPKVAVPPHPTKPAWIVPKDALVDFTHTTQIPFYPACKHLLESEFHRTAFLPRQVACINCAIQGYDLLIALPTSAGKSLCYQLPAIYNKSTITLVVSPTKTLIEDQIRALHVLGPQWESVAQRSHSDHRHPLSPSIPRDSHLRLFYICPEWLDNTEHQRTLYSLCYQNRIARVVVDEAHNAIQGLAKTHRPAYSTLFSLRSLFPQIPFTLVSASLTHSHQVILTTALAAKGRFLSVSAPSRRENFRYRVVHVREGDVRGRSKWKNSWTAYRTSSHSQQTLKIAIITTYLLKRPKAHGFVFVPTRKVAQVVAQKLADAIGDRLGDGIHDRPGEVEGGGGGGGVIEWFHAGEQHRLPDIMHRFNAGLISVLVCTSAFGEGVDNRLVDFVFHYSIPPSMTRYFQETGRVGRDGQQAECILLYSFSDIRTIINVVANDVPSTTSNKDNQPSNSKRRDRAFLPSQRAELQEVLEYCTDSFSCRHKRIFSLFKSPLSVYPSNPSNAAGLSNQTNQSTTSPTERFNRLYTRAMLNTYRDMDQSFLVDLIGQDENEGKEVDEDCGGCDVCERRYRPFTSGTHEGEGGDIDSNDDREGTVEEVDNFQVITSAEIEMVENAFRHDMNILVSELVKRLLSSQGKNTGRDFRRGQRAREVVEFLSVAGVLKMNFEYVRTGKGAGFTIKLEKGSIKVDSIHRPIPIPYAALGPLVLPIRSRKPCKPKSEPTHDETTQATVGDDSVTYLTADTSDEPQDPDSSPSDSDDSVSSTSDTSSQSTEFHKDTDMLEVEASDDGDDLQLIQLDGTEEDGYGMRVTPSHVHGIKPSRNRKRRRSTSFELPEPPLSGGPTVARVPEGDLEVSASPPKRRRTTTTGRDDPSEKPVTEAARMLEKFYTAAKRRKDGNELFSVSNETLRKLFTRHDSIVDEDGFALALREVKASKDDTTILLSWYGWIAAEVFTNRFIIGAKRE